MNTSHSNLIETQRLLEEMARNYAAELPTQIELLENRLFSLRRSSDPLDSYQSLYRQVHSLKGTAGTYGLQIISTICHQFEDYLPVAFDETGHSKEPKAFDRCLEHVDLLKDATNLIRQNKHQFGCIEVRLSELKARMVGSQHHVLIVESSRALAELYIKILESQPLKISIATKGTEAIERLLFERFDLLICGMQLKELNGAAVIAAIRLSQGANSHIPSILISSSAVNVVDGAAPDKVLQRNAGLPVSLLETTQKILNAHPH